MHPNDPTRGTRYSFYSQRWKLFQLNRYFLSHQIMQHFALNVDDTRGYFTSSGELEVVLSCSYTGSTLQVYRLPTNGWRFGTSRLKPMVDASGYANGRARVVEYGDGKRWSLCRSPRSGRYTRTRHAEASGSSASDSQSFIEVKSAAGKYRRGRATKVWTFNDGIASSVLLA